MSIRKEKEENIFNLGDRVVAIDIGNNRIVDAETRDVLSDEEVISLFLSEPEGNNA